MSRRHTSGFDILGMDQDPAPGDPDRIDELARFYEEIRDDAQTGVRVLGRGGSLSRARGESMEKLRDMLGKLPGKLQQTVDSFDAAAQAYRTYARVLRDQQTRIDTAMDQALEAVPATRRVAPRAATDATPDQIAEVRAAADEITGAKARLSAAQRLAADARRLREAASARCRAALDDAADKAIKPPPRRRFFQRIGDFFRNNPIFRLIIDIVIAVVGVVLPVVGIVLAAVALVVTVAVQAANGNFELGTLLVGLVTLVPGAKLLGPIVRGAKSVAPGLVKTVNSGAQAFGQIGRNNTLIKGALTSGGRTGALGRQGVAEFGKGVVQEVATVGLNRVGNPNSEGFNLASIAGGAAAGAAFGTAFDGFRKGSGDGFDLGARPNDDVGTTRGGDTSDSSVASVDTGPSASSVENSGSGVSPDSGPGAPSTADGGPAGTASSPGPSDPTPTVDSGSTGVAASPEVDASSTAPVAGPGAVAGPGPAADRGSVATSGNAAEAGAPPAGTPDPIGGPATSAVPGGAGAAAAGSALRTDAGSGPPVDSPAENGSGAAQPEPAVEPVRETTGAESRQPAGDTRDEALDPTAAPEDGTAVGSADSRAEPADPTSAAGDTSVSSAQNPAESATPGDGPATATPLVSPAETAQGAAPTTAPPPLPSAPAGAPTRQEAPRPEPGRQDASDAGKAVDADSGGTGDDPIEERAAQAVKAAGSGLTGDLAANAIEERQGEEPPAPSEITHGFVLDDEDDTGFTKKTRR
ncbi:hypothetical protein [Actinoplanes derwentensis]|uniref:Uncharacterized protein n=1 Tax=Actinoplanes derwentensis TaxID=113562 RepID=A0A1H2DCE5_9ACTN|nr:hypothetical protein [Actinoplanes derwentensis]GID89526.1 hypothetical protein Ade03nite_84500 [Actinoplanes derwentensis]SDT80415.1 hypothetical protein SAMN04489716_9193 [Actinoplanes derwentensis]